MIDDPTKELPSYFIYDCYESISCCNLKLQERMKGLIMMYCKNAAHNIMRYETNFAGESTSISDCAKSRTTSARSLFKR